MAVDGFGLPDGLNGLRWQGAQRGIEALTLAEAEPDSDDDVMPAGEAAEASHSKVEHSRDELVDALIAQPSWAETFEFLAEHGKVLVQPGVAEMIRHDAAVATHDRVKQTLWLFALLVSRSVDLGVSRAVDEFLWIIGAMGVDGQTDVSDLLGYAASGIGLLAANGATDHVVDGVRGLLDACEGAGIAEQSSQVSVLRFQCECLAAEGDPTLFGPASEWVNNKTWPDTVDVLWAGGVDPAIGVVLQVAGLLFDDQDLLLHSHLVERWLQLVDRVDGRVVFDRELNAALGARALLTDPLVEAAKLNQAAAEVSGTAGEAGGRWLLAYTVELARRAVATTNDSFPDRAAWLSNLSNRLGDAVGVGVLGSEALEEAIECGREAVRLTPDGSPDRPAWLGNLSALLSDAVGVGVLGSEALEEAIECGREAVRLTPDGDPDRAGLLNNLSIHLGDAVGVGVLGSEALEEAIECGREAVRLTPDGSPDRATRLSNLSVCLGDAVGVGVLGSEALEEAIGCGRDAVRLTPDGSPDRPALLSNLSNRLGDAVGAGVLGSEALEEAIECGRDAVRLTPDGHPDRAARLSNLSIHVGDAVGVGVLGSEALEEAIGCGRDAVRLTPDGSPDRATLLNNLSARLSGAVGVGVLGSEALEEAIECGREAVRLTPDGSPDRPAWLGNLSAHLGGAVGVGVLGSEALEEAIECGREAVRLTPDGHPDRATLLNNLSNRLSGAVGVGVLGSEALEEAIGCGRDAVRLTPDGSPDRAGRLSNLSIHLGDAVGVGVLGSEALEEAIECGRDAVRLTPDGSPDRAAWLNNLSIRLGDAVGVGVLGSEALEEAIECGREAVRLTPDGSPDRAGRLNNLSNHLDDAVGVGVLGSEAWSQLADVLETMVAELSSRAVVTPAAQLPRLLRDIPDLAARVAIAKLNVGDQSGAIELLEQARALRLGELERRSTSLLDEARGSGCSEADRFVDVTERLALLESLDHDTAGAQRVLRAEADEALAALRNVEGFADYGIPVGFSKITSRLGDAECLVHVVSAYGQSWAIVSQRSGNPVAVELPVLNDQLLLKAQAFSYGTKAAIAYGFIEACDGLPAVEDERFVNWLQRELDPVNERGMVSVLSRWFGEAVLPLLDDVDRLSLVPVGGLALLPLQVCVVDCVPLIDRFEVRYLLTGSSLVDDYAAPLLPEHRTVAIAAVTDLIFPDAEAKAVSGLTSSGLTVDAGALDVRSFARVLDSASDVHVSTHGEADAGGKNAGLQINGSTRFLASDADRLSRYERGVVVLAACFVRSPGLVVPDEVVGFPNSLMAAGFSSVVAAGWPANDFVSFVFSVRFWRLRESGVGVVGAHSETVRWLRTASKAVVLAELDGVGVGGDTFRVAREWIRSNLLSWADDAVLFGSPFYWGVFTVTSIEELSAPSR